jgi:2-enoate reductase
MLVEVLDDGVMVADKNGNSEKIEADDVILAVGYDPVPFETSGKKVCHVGDAIKAGNLRTVIWNAWDVAMKL